MTGITGARIFNPQLKKVNFKASEFRLDFDGTSRPIGIDAIQFLGRTSEIDVNSYKDLIQKNQKKLSNSYLKYLYSFDDSDITIFCGKTKEQFNAHKIILQCQSDFFKNLLHCKCKESAKSCVILRSIEPEVFQHIMSFIYSGNIIPDRMNFDIWKGLLEASDYLIMKNLKTLCMKYLEADSTRWIKSDDFLKISIYSLIDIIKSDSLKVTDEVLVYQRCLDWANNYCRVNSIETRKEFISELLSEVFQNIRFTLFDPVYLRQCEKSGYISKISLIKIYKKLIKGQVECPRKINDELFTYKSDFDDNGIFYYLGCDKKEDKNSWRNPCEKKSIEIFATGHNILNGSLPDIVGRKNANVWLNTQNSSAFVFDLKTYQAKLSHYTMRHFDQSCCYPKKWAFEGSNDLFSWENLSLHEDPNNQLISQKAQTRTFPTKTPSDFYRYFRIINLSQNSSNWNFGLGGLEIYGELKKLNDNEKQ